MIKPTYEILNQRGTPMFFSDVFANRPAPAIVGRIFISTDTNLIYRDTGTAWNLIGGGSATIGGTIATGQVAFGTALDTIGGTNNLFWDNANNRLGILTSSPLQALHVNGILQAVGNNAIDGNGLSIGWLMNQYGWIQSWGTIPLLLNGNGNNVIIGNYVSDNGNLLQVYGSTFIKGLGSTSATTGLTLQNSAASNLLRILNDGTHKIGNENIDIFPTSNGSAVSVNGRGLIISTNATSQSTGAVKIVGTSSVASDNNWSLWLTHSFTPLSGTATHSGLLLNQTINQTGGANGITRGLYVNPTLTSAADWRSIEWSNNTGWGLYGAGTSLNYLNGLLLLGSTTSTGERLQVTGTMKVTGASTFGGNMALTLNQNANTSFTVTNTTVGSFSVAEFVLQSNTIASFGKTNSSYSTFKTIVASDFYMYNAGAGDISFLNDFASGSIKMAAGGSSTAQLILNSSGNILLGHTTSFTANERMQITGTQQIKDTRTYSTGAIQSLRLEKNLTIPSGATISTGSTLSNEVLAGTNLFQGSVTIPNSSPFAGLYASNLYSFSAASFTITSTQSTGVRSLSQIAAQNYFGGSFSGTLTHVSSIQIGAFLNNSTGTITPVITNAYQLLINDINESAHTFTISNRWGIYQEGASDRNYLAGKTLVGSSTDTGEQFQLTGSIRVNNQLSGSAGGSSGQHLIINCDGTIYKIKLENA